jgi:hypothetical protein
MSKTRLISGRSKKVTGTELAPDRYTFLDLSNAEPDLGLPDTDSAVLVGRLDGTRDWVDLNSVDSFKGYTGSQGERAGFSYQFSDNTVLEDPTNGFLRVDNVNIATVVNLAISKTTAELQDIGGFIGSVLGASNTIRGYLILNSSSNLDDTFAVFSILDSQDNGTWYSITVGYITGTIPDNNEFLSVNFLRNGDVGFTGSQGVDGRDGYTGSQGDIGYTGSEGIGFTGSQGDIGYTGSKGEQGNFGGVTFDYTYSALTSEEDPGIGFLRFNLNDVTAAQFLFIHDTDDTNVNLDNYLATIDSSTSELKGHVRISNKQDSSDFAIFAITGTSANNVTFFTIPISFVSGSATSFTDNEDILITFAKTGDKGDIGYTGSAGIDGVDGINGVDGYTGSQGDIGFTGSEGYTGSQGELGVQGDVGFTGSTGYTGSEGSPGTSAKIVGSVPTDDDLPLFYEGEVGDGYIVQDTGNLWTWTGLGWVEIGRITGYTGSHGTYGGVSFSYLFNKEDPPTATDPQPGNFKLNTVLLSSASILYISDFDATGVDLSEFLTYINSSSSLTKGFFRIAKEYEPTQYALYQITGSIADNTGYFDVFCAFIGASVTNFETGDRLIITFDRTGDKGDLGPEGYTGSAGADGETGYTGSEGESSFAYSTTPPINPVPGDRWFDSSIGAETVWTDDGDSGQWVEVSASGFLGLRGFTGSSGYGSVDLNTRTYTGDGLTRNFTISSNLEVDTALVFVNGQIKTPSVDYTIIDTTLTFTIAPTNGQSIQIREIISSSAAVFREAQTIATGLSIVFGL